MSDQPAWRPPTVEEIPLLSFDALSEHLRLAKVNPGHYLELTEPMARELAARDTTSSFRCMKCGHTAFEHHQLRSRRSWLGSFFGVDSAQYRAVVCTRCKFTELYEGTVPIGQQALDLVFGN